MGARRTAPCRPVGVAAVSETHQQRAARTALKERAIRAERVRHTVQRELPEIRDLIVIARRAQPTASDRDPTVANVERSAALHSALRKLDALIEMAADV